LTRALKGPSEQEIASAEAALLSAQANLEDLKAGPIARDKEMARLAIDKAKNSRWGAQGNRDAVVGGRFSSDAQKDQAESQVLNAEIGVKIAELQYEQMLEPPKTSAIRAAEAQVAQAESTLAKLRSMPSAEDAAVAEAQVAQARVGVESAQKRLNDLEFTAPFGGELATWDLHVGDHVAPGTPVGTLVDTSRYYLDMRIDETEIGQVRVGQIAYITLDAYPKDELEGQASKVDLTGTNNQGIVEYGVRITLPENGLDLKPLMTAAVGIVVEEKADVLLVPNRAILRDKEGKYVEILRDNMPARVSIETGLTSEEHTEILSGLEEGQEVIIGKPRAIALPGPLGH
jgi:RND family efflux transporter MFP subunit